MSDVAISAQRFSGWLERLARFSAPGPGVTRLLYDDAWCAAHAWLREEGAGLGLASTTDAFGNLMLHDPAVPPGTPAILVGSHLDTVVHGGAYDGPYGVLAGLALAASHRGARAPVVAFATCEEEGSRFPVALTGVRGLLGQLAATELEPLCDAAGVRWGNARMFAEQRGCAAALPATGEVPVTFPALRQLELHIEQGPVLEAASEALGIVDRITGYRWVQVTFTGESRHAGTTPMARRRDTLAAAAELALAAERAAQALGPPAVATAGFARATPGLFNVVPGQCVLGLDVRHVEREPLERLVRELRAESEGIAGRRRLALRWDVVFDEPPTALDAGLAAGALALAQTRGIAHRRMSSGAGHDTMAFAQAGVPALMLFVPSRGGISHHPDELTAAEQLWAGVEFAHALLQRWREELA